jgi:3-oxoacyl-[acyl-carrier protein] reductase
MDGVTAVVTGADRPLGRAVAAAFAEAGATVAAGGRDGDALEDLGAGVEDAVGRVRAVRTDARDEFDVERLLEIGARMTGAVDVVVGAAVVRHGPADRPLPADSYAALDDQVRTNARGAFAVVREAGPHLASDGRVLLAAPGAVADAPTTAFDVSVAATVAVARGAATHLDQAVCAVDPGTAVLPGEGEASGEQSGEAAQPSDSTQAGDAGVAPIGDLFREAAVAAPAPAVDGAVLNRERLDDLAR